MSYDPQNVFAKILRSEIPAGRILEDEHSLAIEDIHPQAPVHSLVIPKSPYESLLDFADEASDAELASLVRMLAKLARAKGVDRTGFRVLANVGADGHQEVQHLHFHLFGGRRLGPMIKRPAADQS
ncbi:MAG: HIT domain-containing protein [Alphaproteobacteria bacterium]|jgi:histidine triad (HIT) family protein|nr:HIT domain-containing protein [Alphaproteobacteria bacterium]